MSSFWPQTAVDWAQVLSAIGTCGAVVVSLWLSQRKPKPEARVTAGLRVMIGAHTSDPLPEFLAVSVVNVGAQPLVLEAIGWRVRRRWLPGYIKQAAYQTAVTTTLLAPNPPLPSTLHHGQSNTFYLATFGEFDWFDTARNHGFFADQFTSRRSLNRLRVYASTSLGIAAHGKPETAFLDRLWSVMCERETTARQPIPTP